jgi:hypothetical protein
MECKNTDYTNTLGSETLLLNFSTPNWKFWCKQDVAPFLYNLLGETSK